MTSFQRLEYISVFSKPSYSIFSIMAAHCWYYDVIIGWKEPIMFCMFWSSPFYDAFILQFCNFGLKIFL